MDTLIGLLLAAVIAAWVFRAGKSIGQGFAISRPVGRRIGCKAELLQLGAPSSIVDQRLQRIVLASNFLNQPEAM